MRENVGSSPGDIIHAHLFVLLLPKITKNNQKLYRRAFPTLVAAATAPRAIAR
jgi:hypothetical protein